MKILVDTISSVCGAREAGTILLISPGVELSIRRRFRERLLDIPFAVRVLPFCEGVRLGEGFGCRLLYLRWGVESCLVALMMYIK